MNRCKVNPTIPPRGGGTGGVRRRATRFLAGCGAARGLVGTDLDPGPEYKPIVKELAALLKGRQAEA